MDERHQQMTALWTRQEEEEPGPSDTVASQSLKSSSSDGEDLFIDERQTNTSVFMKTRLRVLKSPSVSQEQFRGFSSNFRQIFDLV